MLAISLIPVQKIVKLFGDQHGVNYILDVGVGVGCFVAKTLALYEQYGKVVSLVDKVTFF